MPLKAISIESFLHFPQFGIPGPAVLQKPGEGVRVLDALDESFAHDGLEVPESLGVPDQLDILPLE